MKEESTFFSLRIILVFLLIITSVSYALSQGSIEFNETLLIVRNSIYYSSIDLDSDNLISFYVLFCTDIERQSSEIAIRIATNGTSSMYGQYTGKSTITLSYESFAKFAKALERSLELELNPGERLYFDSNGLLSLEIDSMQRGELIFGGGRYYHLHYDSSYSDTSPNNTAYELTRSDIEKICQSASELVARIELFDSAKKPTNIVPETVLVEKGSFTMGDDSLEDASPSQQVTITYDFRIGKYEVTFNEYDWFVRETGYSLFPKDAGWGRGTRPVINVSWNDAIAYCNWLSEKEGLPVAYDNNGNLLDKDGRITTDPSKVLGYRLPTEAEWEYAARGGNKSGGYKYAGSDNVDDVAWYWQNSGDKYLTGELDWDTIMENNCRTQEVGKKAPNELGLYDMSGNVYEWCSDWYGDYSGSTQRNPYNSTAGSDRVFRGGSWSNDVAYVQVVDRSSDSPAGTYGNLGFRICRTVPYEGENRPHLAPYNPNPSDEAIVGATTVTLRWDSYDPDGDTMTYDVYFDTNATPTTKVSSNQTENTLIRSNLSYDTTYYWKVVAKDNHGGVTEGPVWKFTTSVLVLKGMVLLERGSFTMGDTWGDVASGEKPTHKVTLTYNFYIGKYETTFDEYDAFCEATGRSKPDDEGWGRGSRPVINVSRWGAIAYCNWLSEKEDLPKAYDDYGNLLDKDGRVTTDPSKVLGYRLPTEAEWEYAARGGNKSKGYKYAGSDNIDDVAWYNSNSGHKTQEGGKKAPNELGIYDMSGNVWEWCSDWYGDYSSSAQTNPYNSTAGSLLVVRGGSWYDDASYARVADRCDVSHTDTLGHLGFRICRTVPYEGENRPPLSPYNPNPSDEAIVGATTVTLRWDSYDPDGDTMTYDVYFDTNANSTTKVSSEQTENTLIRSNLSYDTTYYWKVVAKDSKGATTEGPVWELIIQELPLPQMILVEKGSFTMGDTWGDGYSYEKPTHKVTLTYDFYIGEYETTFDEYDAFCNTTGRSKPDDWGWGGGTRPVIWVSWNDAIAYCNWLSEKEKLPKAYDNNGNLLDKDGRVTTDPSKVLGYRLPTEAEWEYAARGGNKSKGYKYAGSDNIDDVAWYNSNSGHKTQEGGKKAPNELGIYDMSGNVWEWCSDWYGDYSGSAQINPYNNSGSHRVYRGGCWYSDATDVRVALRKGHSPTFTIHDLGFRICRTVLYEGENRPPLSPYKPSPADEAIAGATTVTLRWGSYDPDDDTMTYDVYLDTNVNPTTKVSSNQAENTLIRSNLSYDTTYYWKVVAKDSKGATTEGPVWRFIIQELPLPQMVLVEKGSFTMGDTWGDGYEWEKPTHKVTLTYNFYIGKYETTFDEYDAFCETTGRSKPYDIWDWERGRRPVIEVSWWDAIAYCNWLSDREKLPKAYDSNGNLLDKDGMITTDPSKVVGYRLPTEAEWEYAARGGNKSEGYRYSGSDNVDDVAWYWDNSENKTQEVGKKAPNELGLYDMSGNVREWCSDWFEYYISSAQTNPYNNSGSNRVHRGGGSWYSSVAVAHVAFRSYVLPTYSSRYLGFRITRTVAYTESKPAQVSDFTTMAVYVNGTLNVISMDNTSGIVSVIRNPYQYQGKVSPVTNGDLIYMVDDTGRLVTLRVSGTTIETVSSLNTGTSPETLVLAGGYLWLLDTKSAAVVLRISLDNGGIPIRSESVFRDWTTPVDMFVSEDLSRIYLADAFSGIKVLERSGSSYGDVSSRFPVSLNGYARSVVAVQNLVISGESGIDGGLKMIDLSRSVRSNLGEYYIVPKLLVSNNIVYAITDKGVSIIDISSPSQPVILRDIEISQVDEIRVSGRLLAVRAGNRLLIYDVLSAGNPVLLNELEFTTNSSHKVVSITYALFSSGIDRVKLVAGSHGIISSGQRAELEVDWPLDFDTVSVWAVLEDSVEFIGAARVTASSSSRSIPVISESGETKGSVRIELK